MASRIPVEFPEAGGDIEAVSIELRALRETIANTPRLAVKDVLRRYGRSRSWLYMKLKHGFPQRAANGLWRPADLDAWDAGQAQRTASTDSPDRF